MARKKRRKPGPPRPRASRVGNLGTGITHWGPRSLLDNLDEVVTDPRHPQAFPTERPTDLMGRIRVRLTAEDGALVAYGFGGQRIAVRGSDAGAVQAVDSYRARQVTRGRALLVLDHEHRILLRARGQWETYGEVARVCRAAGAPAPSHVAYVGTRQTATRSGSGSGRGGGGRPRTRVRLPLYQKAPGYRALRTRPRGATPRALALITLALATVGCTTFAGAALAMALPEWIGSVRVLIGIAGMLLGIAGGIWLCVAVSRVAMDAVRWMAASLRAASPAPPDRFFQRRERSGKWAGAATAGLILAVPALIGWGPGVGIASLAHGLSDSRLVAELRADGVSAPGFLVDVPDYSTSDNGDITVTDVPTLSFSAGPGKDHQEATDPAIGGRPLSLDPADPDETKTPVTVVYLPANPGTAAARQQITGSVWHGAPTANLITGGLFTLALPPLIWAVVWRLRRRRWLRDRALIEEIIVVDA